MATQIHPASLKSFRDRKHWTQEQLAEATKGKSKVSLPTIKRIESTKDGSYPANDRVAEGLAKALGCTIDDLSKPPTDEAAFEASLRRSGYRPLRTMVDAETALAFNMVEHIYGIPIQTQVVMAPLFTALLAEASLAWRRERVAEIKEAAGRLMSLGGGHFSFASSAYRADEGADLERKCIEKRDLFGKDVWDQTYDLGYDDSTNNPFADFLKYLAQQAEAKTVAFRGDWFDEIDGWKTSEGMPQYRIGADIIESITGLDDDAEYALLRGHVRLKDIPADLLGDEKEADRIAWLTSRIPQEELEKRKKERAELLALLGDISLANSIATADGAEEADDA